MREATPHLPTQAPIEAYGNGGFRFAGMSHKGSILALPSGIWAWPAPADAAHLTLADLARAIAEKSAIEVLLLGTGRVQVFPPLELRRALIAERIGCEPMDTGAAARTYNVLLAEKRRVGAALIAVD
jgi:uncharacterized protein